VILPEMVGKEFIPVEIKPEMIGRRLGESAITNKLVKHGRAGVGVSYSVSRALSMNE